jgi:hypothetical protein
LKKSLGVIGGLTSLWIAGTAAAAESPNAAAGDVEATAAPAATASGSPSVQAEQSPRAYSRYRFNALGGTTGLLHTSAADSGAPGTFRLSYLLSYYSGNGFLCPTTAACGITATNRSEDSVSRHGEDIAVSATLANFLEAGMAVHTQSVSDDLYNPSVMQVLADAQFGFKAFTPKVPDRGQSPTGRARYRRSEQSYAARSANSTSDSRQYRIPIR